ncbi:MAG: hypothetical protein ABL867_06620 [Rickettsiales bacterium]
MRNMWRVLKILFIIFLLSVSLSFYLSSKEILPFVSKFPKTGETTNMQPVDIELFAIAENQERYGVFLSIPMAYMDYPDYWKGGSYNVVTIIAEWRDMQPWAVAKKSNSSLNYKDRILINLGTMHKRPNMDTFEKIYVGNLIDKGVTPDGYRRYVPKDAKGENGKIIPMGHYNEVLLPIDNNQNDVRVIDCVSFNINPNVGCTVHILSSQSGLSIDYTFARKEFEHWREIDKKVIDFANDLIKPVKSE